MKHDRAITTLSHDPSLLPHVAHKGLVGGALLLTTLAMGWTSKPLAEQLGSERAQSQQAVPSEIIIEFAAPTSELNQNRAKQGADILQLLNENEQSAWLEQNQLQSDVTGNNIIHDRALHGVEGIATVIQNSGNQVIIQNGTLLNLTITP